MRKVKRENLELRALLTENEMIISQNIKQIKSEQCKNQALISALKPILNNTESAYTD